MANINFDDHEVLEVLGTLIRRANDPTKLMAQIGEMMVDRTKERFGTSTSPTGERWKPDRASTVTRYLQQKYGQGGRAFSKKKRHQGTLTKFGLGEAMVKKPLIGETRRLSSEIFYRVTPAGKTLRVGSSMIYAAAQQFGMRKGYAGHNKRGAPIPWGDIPPRPFLGASSRDRSTILDLARDWMLPK